MNLTDLESQVQELRSELRAMKASIDRLDEWHPVHQSLLLDHADSIHVLEAQAVEYQKVIDQAAALG